MGNLTRAEVADVCRLSEPGGKPQGLRWTDAAIESVHALTDGHPLLVQAVCAGIWQRFAPADRAVVAHSRRDNLEGEASLSLVLEEAGDGSARIWAKLLWQQRRC